MISLLAEGDGLLARVRHQGRRVLIEGFTAEEGPESYVVAACLPDPAFLGDAMHGKTCAGLWVTGLGKDGKPREVYLYHVVDNQDTMRDYGAQCVAWQTAINPVVALELLAAGTWSGAGVLGPEAFDAVPFLDLLAGDYASPWGLTEMAASQGH